LILLGFVDVARFLTEGIVEFFGFVEVVESMIVEVEFSNLKGLLVSKAYVPKGFLNI